MGAFYGNITLKGATQTQVVNALQGRRAAVAPSINDFVVAFDSVCDDQDTDAMKALASRLSAELRCIALATIVHDDDVLLYLCCRNGELVDWYNSNPNYFESTQDSDSPSGGNADVLCALFNVSGRDKVHAILHAQKFTFETDRHRILVRELSLPTFAVGTALASLDQGEYPDGLAENETIRAADPPPTESFERQQDRRFFASLGNENAARVCKRDGCNRGTVPLSLFCKPHHFEMVRGYPCPFTH